MWSNGAKVLIRLNRLRIRNPLPVAIRISSWNPTMVPLANFATESKNQASFASLLRSSPLVQLGDPQGKIVVGKIVDVVDNDLYVDFGFKFNAVCRRPKTNSSSYVRGAKVKVKINDLEMCDRFLGSAQDMTLLEADVTLLGLVSTPVLVKS